MNADWDIAEELSRKSGEAYSWLHNEYQRGQIEPSAYYTALIALDLALLGLIPEEFSQWASATRQHLALQKDLGSITALQKGETVAVVKADRNSPSVSVVMLKSGNRTSRVYEFEDCVDPYRAAHERYRQVIDTLIKNGYEVV